MPSSREAALIRAIHRARNSRFLARRSRYAYWPAFITASLAMRKTALRRPRKPLACSRTFLCRARAVTPRLTLGMAAPYAYGSMALTESRLVLWISAVPRNCRLLFVVFLVRMWRLNAIERLMLPLPRTWKRFFAPLFVFIFGMTSLFGTGHELRPYLLPTAVLSCGEALGPASGFVG